MPEFVLFSGEEKKSTIEHIARFSVQCGEARSKDYLKLRCCASTGSATCSDVALKGIMKNSYVPSAKNAS